MSDNNPERRSAKTRQLQAWEGGFGEEYIERNDFEEWKMEYGVKAFRRIFKGIKPDSILEVGSNIGRNLYFIDNVLNKSAKLYALEPNRKAYERLISPGNGLKLEAAYNCDAFSIPLSDSSVDLTFTAGVLIHIAPDDLGRAVDEIIRVSRKYVLCIEYFSHTPEDIVYHGQKGLLFKRDFGGFYLDRFPNLEIVNYGFLWQREFRIFDDLTWWLFKRTKN